MDPASLISFRSASKSALLTLSAPDDAEVRAPRTCWEAVIHEAAIWWGATTAVAAAKATEWRGAATRRGATGAASLAAGRARSPSEREERILHALRLAVLGWLVSGLSSHRSWKRGGLGEG